MTRVSFTLPTSTDLNKIIDVLKRFDIEDIQTNNQSHGLTQEDLKNIEISRKQIKRGEAIPSRDVHQQMWEKYGN